MFLAPWFALAGVLAAAGVWVIHFLNRRRYKVVYWAAMDFLREAIFRNRRLLQLRDLILLALRTACLILFGLAMARPFLGKSVSQIDPNKPVHAVVLVDNSLSMGYREFKELDETLLDSAKDKAKELIERLPRGSRISVLPTCGAPAGFSYEAYYSKDDAIEALEQLEPVDRATMARGTIDLALEACRRVTDMPAKKIFLVTDQQVASWPAESLADHLKQLPGPIEVVEVVPKELENAWISEVKLRDGVADLQTPAVFIATVEYEGGTVSRRSVRLVIDGVDIATKTVELQPGQKREVEFPPYQFDVATEPGVPTFVVAEVAFEKQDKLPADDQRFAVVPVVATLPVVFVDQWGKDQEDPRKNRYGETFHLRRLLVPLTSRTERSRQLVEIRHVTMDQLEGATGRSLLEDARLVVIAGVSNPENSVPLLREYVEQGGNLVIAAGGHFDPALWNEAAWKDGLGILPAPLDSVTVGRLPEETAGVLDPFKLDYNSLQNHEYFLLEGTSREEQQDLYQLPYFFKTVKADAGEKVKEDMVVATTKAIEQHRKDLAEIDRQLAELDEKESRQKLTPEEAGARTSLRRQRQQLEPSWLLWNPPGEAEDDKQPVEELGSRTKPSVLARYTNGLPFMIERRLGRGRVLFVSTGVFPEWNTLPLTNAVLLYDRILRGMLESTLPDRNLGSERQIELPVAAAQRSASFTLTDPDGVEKSLAVDAVGGDRWGITLGDLMRRGHYQVTAARTRNLPQDKETPDEGLETKLWVVSLAVNGPAEESRLISAEEARLRQGRGQAGSLEEVQTFAAEGLQLARLRGTGLWRWFMLAVLACLLAEMAFLVWPSLGREETE